MASGRLELPRPCGQQILSLPCLPIPPRGRAGGRRVELLRRRLILVQEAVERLLGFGVLHRLLVAHLGGGFAGQALEGRDALRRRASLSRNSSGDGIGDVAEGEDGGAARGVVEVAAEELDDRLGGALVADLAERGEDALLTSGSVPRRKSICTSTGVASAARRCRRRRSPWPSPACRRRRAPARGRARRRGRSTRSASD